MEIKELQERVDAWIREYGVRYFSELTNMTVLTEEVGELARVMARKYGDQSFKKGEAENLADEMADVLWVLCAWPTRRASISRPPSKPISPRKPPATRSGTATTRNFNEKRLAIALTPKVRQKTFGVRAGLPMTYTSPLKCGSTQGSSPITFYIEE